jgi:hypothetical protein
VSELTVRARSWANDIVGKVVEFERGRLRIPGTLSDPKVALQGLYDQATLLRNLCDEVEAAADRERAAFRRGAELAREACAKLCDSLVGDSDGSAYDDGFTAGLDRCAAAIRATPLPEFE